MLKAQGQLEQLLAGKIHWLQPLARFSPVPLAGSHQTVKATEAPGCGVMQPYMALSYIVKRLSLTPYSFGP